jgi:GH24 family phage-related lysozyme (muramidase)
MTAIAILSEIGGDMSVFPTAKNLVSWAGCCPRNDQSAGKIKSTRISCAGCYLKPLLVQISNALLRSKKHLEFRERYRRIKARRGHKKAIIAVCRMLLTAIWNVLSKLEPYTPEGFLQQRPVSEDKVITKAQAEEFLLSDIAVFEKAVNDQNLDLTQNMFDALVSFTFNVGVGNFKRSTLLCKIMVNPWDNSIMDEFLRWVYSKGRVLPGLQRRRLAEMKLYFSKD